MDALTAALEYAAAGWRVIPLAPGRKLPATEDGWKSGTTDVQQLAAWFAGSNYGVGICTGFPGPIVLDFDVKDGEEVAIEVRRQLQRAHLLVGCGWQVGTPSGGLHMYYEAAQGDDKAARYAPALDVKAAGGYVVAPPTHTEAGDYVSLTQRRPACRLSALAVAQVLRPPTPTRAASTSDRTDFTAAFAHADSRVEAGGSRHDLIGWLLGESVGAPEADVRDWAERVKPGSGSEVDGWLRWLSRR